MIRHLLPGALIAGTLAGAVAALLHVLFVTPSLLEAELFETGARVHFAAGDPASPAGGVALWADWGRHLGTLGFDIITYCGFALMLTALFVLAQSAGRPVTARAGLVWGVAGFIAVHLAPSAGLAPEPPGIEAAALTARQIWWVGTVCASGVGLALVAFGRGALAPAAGVALLAAPHIIGAPQLEAYSGVVPPEIASRFVGRSLAAAAASWASLGWLVAYFFNRKEA